MLIQFFTGNKGGVEVGAVALKTTAVISIFNVEVPMAATVLPEIIGLFFFAGGQ